MTMALYLMLPGRSERFEAAGPHEREQACAQLRQHCGQLGEQAATLFTQAGAAEFASRLEWDVDARDADCLQIRGHWPGYSVTITVGPLGWAVEEDSAFNPNRGVRACR
jgi:hypothetical protein